MEYRREIDGLRALAVIPVIFFHAGFTPFSGGYVGVDVFFVISGYLITSIIVSERQAGTFSLVNFYERRARRILPALFLVMAACIPLAWFWLLPGDMKDFSQSVLAVSAFISNILFWQQSGYFGIASELKPLLHTWSLAVEEQYYVIFPPLLMALWWLGRRWMTAALALIAAASLAAAQFYAVSAPEATFFLLPTRGWELLIGSFVALYLLRADRTDHGAALNQWGSALGIGLIIYSILFFDKNTPFPSFYALMPTVGAAMIILFARPTTFVGTLLSTKLLVGIGLISYSAYLWHQPLFVFARHLSLKAPSNSVFLVLSVLTLFLAYLSWRFVEQPFRRKERFGRKSIFSIAAAGTFGFMSFGLAVSFTEGVPHRFSEVRELFPGYEIDNKKLQQESWRLLQPASVVADDSALEQEFGFSGQPGKIRVLIVGNSHAKDTFNMFAQNSDVFPQFEFARYGMQLRYLGSERAASFFDSESYKAADVILISTRWGGGGSKDGYSDISFLEQDGKAVLGSMRNDGKLVVLTTSSLEFPVAGGRTLTDTIVLHAASKAVDNPSARERGELIAEINRRHFSYRNSVKKIRQLNEAIRASGAELGLIVLDKKDYMCMESEKICMGITPSFEKVFYDHGHYSLSGAKEFGIRAHAIGWLRPLEDALLR